jgi:hypothetical protein
MPSVAGLSSWKITVCPSLTHTAPNGDAASACCGNEMIGSSGVNTRSAISADVVVVVINLLSDFDMVSFIKYVYIVNNLKVYHLRC